ncbi:MAG: methionine--tRNA ligase [Thermodesulfobacteriota bacterium]
MTERIYITTPLYYANAEPHLGSTYTTVVCDAFARFHRQRGAETFLLTGTDEHGEKIAQAAAAAGRTPKDFVDEVSGRFRAVWDSVGIRYDHFMRTSDPHHVRFVQEVLARIHASGDIYFGSYSGLYCVGCERLYTEKELVDGLCPQHLTKPVEIEEPNYFFRMEKYQDALRAHIEANPGFIRPEGYRSEALAMLREPIGDLCISRPKARLEWGIEMPFDAGYVTYVWFDALLNYVSGLEAHGLRERLWPYASHFVAKDILKPHAIFWPTMLLAAGFPLYRHLNVHGYWTSGGQKMSKSLGNVVEPLALRDRYGMDAVRYFLLREAPFGSDADFTEAALVTRINADLANGLGNLASRTLAMMQRYFAGEVQALEPRADADRELERAYARERRELDQHVRALGFHRGLEAIWRALDAANKYIVATAPFTLAKDPAQKPRVGAVLHNCLEALRVTAQLVAPFLPDTAERLRVALALDEPRFADLQLAWGTAFSPGHRVGEPVALFPRIETEDAKTGAVGGAAKGGGKKRPS